MEAQVRQRFDKKKRLKKEEKNTQKNKYSRESKTQSAYVLCAHVCVCVSATSCAMLLDRHEKDPLIERIAFSFIFLHERPCVSECA